MPPRQSPVLGVPVEGTRDASNASMSTVIHTGPRIERRESRRFIQFDLLEEIESKLDARCVSIRSSDSERDASSRDQARYPILNDSTDTFV